MWGPDRENGDATLRNVDINWPEVLIGGTIFFVLGAVFTLFVQRPLEARLEARRRARREAVEQNDNRLAQLTALVSKGRRLHPRVLLARLPGAPHRLEDQWRLLGKQGRLKPA